MVSLISMVCFQCKHDFCWVCQEAWSKHSSETGGYFRCNRFEVVTKVEEKAESLLTDVSVTIATSSYSYLIILNSPFMHKIVQD